LMHSIPPILLSVISRRRLQYFYCKRKQRFFENKLRGTFHLDRRFLLAGTLTSGHFFSICLTPSPPVIK
jgi:hypothetical protein